MWNERVWMKRTAVGIAVLPDSISASALDSEGRRLGEAETARTGDLRVDVESLLVALGKKVPAVSRGKFRAAIGWGGQSVLAVVGMNGAGAKARDGAVRESLEKEAGRPLDGWRIAWTGPNGGRTLLAGAVPRDDLLAVDTALEAVGGETMAAGAIALILAERVGVRAGNVPLLVFVALPGSCTLFLRDEKGRPVACRHRPVEGEGAGLAERVLVEVSRGLLEWETGISVHPPAFHVVDGAGLAGLSESLEDRVAVPVQNVSFAELAPGAASSVLGNIAAITARSIL